MARYLERAAHLCRLMQLQVETLVDRPLREIHFGWNRVYSSMNQSPPAGPWKLSAAMTTRSPIHTPWPTTSLSNP